MTTEARRVMDEAMTEKQFQDQIVRFARLHLWKTFHPYDSRRSTAGFPDLTLARIGMGDDEDWTTQLVFFEVKRQTGRVTEAQAMWIRVLDNAPGVVARVVRPSDWDAIVALLTTPPRGRGGR